MRLFSGRSLLISFVLLLVCSTSGLVADETTSKLPSSADIQTLTFEPALESGHKLRGRDARKQLFVTGKHKDGRLIDYTRSVKFTSEPKGLIEIDETGFVRPVSDGTVTITATTSTGAKTTTTMEVTDTQNHVPVNFKNQVVPIFTKLGCNSGGCHGKSSGQNGFRLSLLGFYPEDDYEFLVKESRGRRLFPFAPGESLLLKKGISESPHGGGKRLEKDSDEYRMLYRWIEQGMPYGSAEDPVVTSIKCYPEQRIMDRETSQQIAVYATYSDGHVEDVTRMALFEANDSEMAEASKTGLVETRDLAGEVAIMARFQGQVATYRATIPLGADTSKMPQAANFIDTAVFNKLKLLGIPPSEVCDDATFLRRVYVDIAGILPTEKEVSEFITNKDNDKRKKVIDDLLERPEYADLFANKWNLVLRNRKQQNEDRDGLYTFYEWIWESIDKNKPYDQFVKEIIAASGDSRMSPPVIWYREVASTDALVEDTAQLFLGVRIQCARCHHHPFEKWSQNDYYSMAAFFSRIGKKNLPGYTNNRAREKRIYHNIGSASARNPRSGANLKPAGLGSAALEIPAESDPRLHLANWMSEPDNPFFAPTLVNRYWKHFFSRGIVEPEDDMRATNPPSNPELLQGLSQHFVKSGYDLKDLVRTICNSKTYQLSSMPNEYNLKDKQNFSRYYPKRLSAEVLYDSVHQVAGVQTNFSNLEPGSRAVELRDVSTAPYFLKVFGQPQGETACECERSQDASLAQSLHLLNSSDVQNLISNGNGRANQFSREKDRPHEDRVKELYRWTFSREPNAEELDIAVKYINRDEKIVKDSYEDLVWALINSKEFLFNH